MSDETMIIRVRPVFRVLGIVICVISLLALYDLFLGQPGGTNLQKYSQLVAVLAVVPLMLSSCILGRVPFCIIRSLPKYIVDDMEKSEIVIFEYSFKTTIISIVVFSIAAFYIWVF